MDCIWLGQDRDMGSLRGKSPLSRPRRKWDGMIEFDTQEIRCGCMDWIGLGQDREIGKLGGKKPFSRPRG